MSLTDFAAKSPRWDGGVSQVESAVETVLADRLKEERDRIGVDQATDEMFADALKDFEEWAAVHRLPCTPHVLAAYLYEMHTRFGMSSEDVEYIVAAYLYAHAWDVRTPILAALRFCQEAPLQVAAH
jgi:transcription initiation factor TFIIIB Brf1 subunit/transcription initiation factor TFIIB